MSTFFPHTVSSIFRLSLTRLVRLSRDPCRCLASRSRREELECFMHDCFTIELTGECLKCLFRLTEGVPAVVVQLEALWARIPEIQVRIPSRAMGTFFPHTVSSIFPSFSDTHTHTHTHTHTQHTHTHTHTLSEVYVSTDARRACPRSVIGSMVGAYPRGTGSNPVEGNGHFFPSYR